MKFRKYARPSCPVRLYSGAEVYLSRVISVAVWMRRIRARKQMIWNRRRLLSPLYCYIISCTRTRRAGWKSQRKTHSPIGGQHRWARLRKQQSSITVDGLPNKENKLSFSVSSVFRIYIYIYIYEKRNYQYIYVYIHISKYISTYLYIYIYILYIHIYIYIDRYTAVSNGKQKIRRFSLIRLPFAHRANGSLSFVRLLTKKQTEWSVCKRTKRTCPSMENI